MLFDDAELTEIQAVARARRMTVAEWVRQALRRAREEEPMHEARSKLEAVRRAAEHSFPTADVDRMLAEVERGYLAGGAEPER